MASRGDVGLGIEALLVQQVENHSKTIDEFKNKLQSLREENQDLLEQLQTKEHDTMEVIRHLRKENDRLQEELRAYQEEKESAIKTAEDTIRQASEDRDRAIAEMEASSKQKDDTREAELRKLQQELADLRAFAKDKERMEHENNQLRMDLNEAQQAHKEAMTGVERKLIEEKTRLQKEAHAQLMEIKRNTDEEVVNRLDVSTKRILQQNRRLAEDLKLHVQETAELQRQKGKLEEENRALKRDLSLNEDQIQTYAKDRFKHSKEVKDLQSKVKNLEKSLAQVVKDFERERERLVHKGKADVEDSEVENSGLRKLLKLKDKEHTRIKRLAQDIIMQRTEVEQFFLESLEHVRDEITRERSRPSPTNDSTFITSESSTHFQGRLPQLPPRSVAGQVSKQSSTSSAGGVGPEGSGKVQYQPNQKVDIRDLNWEDKVTSPCPLTHTLCNARQRPTHTLCNARWRPTPYAHAVQCPLSSCAHAVTSPLWAHPLAVQCPLSSYTLSVSSPLSSYALATPSPLSSCAFSGLT